MEKKPAVPVPAVDAESTDDAFAWPRRPTVRLVQVPFDLEAAEQEGDTPCD
jgi:hypothetical protein